MQYADDTELDAALRGGQTIEVGYRFRLDWNKNDQFDSDYSDLSDTVVEATMDAQFTGSYPAEFEVNDGYAQRRLTVHVTGEIHGVQVMRFFSPYSGQLGGSIDAVNTPATFDVLIQLPGGQLRSIRQFTGFLIQATPKRSDGTVELELADVSSQLTNPITFAPTARSQALRQWAQEPTLQANQRHQMRGGNSLSWYLLDACRRSGLYQGPKPPAGAKAYWTLAGGVLPEVGTLAHVPRDYRQAWPISKPGWIMPAFYQCYYELPMYYDSLTGDGVTTDDQGNQIANGMSYPTGPWSPDINTPDVYPIYMWDASTWGPVMRFDCYNPDSSISGGVSDAMRCIGTTNEPIMVPKGQRTRVYLGGWQLFDSTVASANVTSVTALLGGFANVTEAGGNISYLGFDASPRDKTLLVYMPVQSSAGSLLESWRYQARFTDLTDGWHYVAVMIEFPGDDVSPTLRFNIDGYEVPVNWQTKGKAGWWHSVNVYAQADGRDAESSPVQIITCGGAQHWGVWTQNGLTSANAARDWSIDDAYTSMPVTTDIGPSSARVMWTPSTVGKPAWDVLKEIGSSDLGVLYTSEDGVLHYTNWHNILLARDSGKTTTILSLDDVAEVNPFTTFDSIANAVTYTSQEKYFVDDAIFRATDAQQFVVASGRTARYQTTVDDCMSILPGNVTTRRLAQGYWQTATAPTDNPIVNGAYAYTPQDFMRAYPPDKWKNGMEGHNRGDIRPNGQQQQPLEGLGVYAYANVGWARGDPDPRHLTISLLSTNSIRGRATMFAVDDNTAFLNIRGYKITAEDQYNETVYSTDATSLAKFGTRNIARPQSDWASDYSTQWDLTQMLADELAQPRPVFSSLETRGDPRRQLQDVVAIDDADGTGGPMYCSVVGINRKFDNQNGITETLALRTFGPRTGFWILDDQSFSRLDETTLLA